MTSQQDSRLTEAVAIRPNPIAALAGAGLSWVADRPAYIKMATAVTLLFGLVVAATSLVIGTPFSVPNERISMVLGINVVIPIGWAMATYLRVQGYQVRRCARQSRARPTAHQIA